MIYFVLVAWMFIVFVLMCTTPALAFLKGDINLVLNPEPSWSNLFSGEISRIEFWGHFILFFVLAALLQSVIKKSMHVFWSATLYGVLLEFIQPFFGRGAEFIDVFANILGIVSYIALFKIAVLFSLRDSKQEEPWGRF